MALAAHYYLMTSLPALGALGDAPPVSLRQLYERASETGDVRQVVEAVLLEHDLMQRQAFLARELDRVEPVVLSEGQVRGEEPLPQDLQGEAPAAGALVDDVTWEAYFCHAAGLSGRLRCPFLREWVGFEVALRNALVMARARTLELAADEYIVAGELAREEALVGSIVARWSAAADLLSAQRAVDQGRWEWLNDHCRWYSFGVDEAAAYARGLLLLHRWRKVGPDE